MLLNSKKNKNSTLQFLKRAAFVVLISVCLPSMVMGSSFQFTDLPLNVFEGKKAYRPAQKTKQKFMYNREPESSAEASKHLSFVMNKKEKLNQRWEATLNLMQYNLKGDDHVKRYNMIEDYYTLINTLELTDKTRKIRMKIFNMKRIDTLKKLFRIHDLLKNCKVALECSAQLYKEETGNSIFLQEYAQKEEGILNFARRYYKRSSRSERITLDSLELEDRVFFVFLAHCREINPVDEKMTRGMIKRVDLDLLHSICKYKFRNAKARSQVASRVKASTKGQNGNRNSLTRIFDGSMTSTADLERGGFFILPSQPKDKTFTQISEDFLRKVERQ